MAVLTKSAFYTKYVDPATGLFRAGQPAYAIGPDDYEQFVADLRDSVLWPADEIQELSVTLNQAQILTSNTAPVQLLAAPGAGKMYVIQDPIISRYTYDTALFTPILNTVTVIRIGGVQISEVTQVIGSANNSICINSLEESTAAADTAFINQNVNFFAQNGNPTGGGALSTLKIYFRYKIINI